MAPYEQLRRYLAAQIDTGEVELDSRLPTVRDLARQSGLAANTVAKAYRELETAGYVRTEGRRGTFVAARHAPREGDGPTSTDQDAVAACLGSEMALLRRDTYRVEGAVEDWFDDDFVMVYRDGRLLGRRAAITAMGFDAEEASTVEDLRSERVGTAVVIVTYATRRGASACRHSALWARGVGGWVCRFRQSTPVL